MNRYIKFVLVFCLSFLVFFCKSTEKTDNSNIENPKKIEKIKLFESKIIEKYAKSVNISYNQDSTFGLVTNQNKPTSKIPFPVLNCFVYSIEPYELIYSEIYESGKAIWLDNEVILFETVPRQELINGHLTNKSYYNVIKREKY